MNPVFDVVIVGAGAAGLMTAIVCRRQDIKNILLLDGQQKIGAKILMSGGTRCNVTNAQVDPKDFNSENSIVVRNVLYGFSSSHAIDFFQKLGVKFVVEPGGKYFPTTHSGKTILDALNNEIVRRRIRLETSKKVNRIHFKKGLFYIQGEGFEYVSKTVVMCSGGLSYPMTGSDGVGYNIAKSFGHTIIQTSPALTPLKTDDEDWKSLSGVSLECLLTLKINQVNSVSFEGPLLFTHFGFSGPAVLNISRHWDRLGTQKNVILEANFLPKENLEALFKNMRQFAEYHPKGTLKRFLTESLPERFVQILLKKNKLSPMLILSQVKKESRETLAKSILNHPLKIIGVMGYQKAEVTAGGIDLREIESKTLESKLQPGLFFAGEILDADGRIGGFNFQWAWSSGVVAARAIAKIIGTDTN